MFLPIEMDNEKHLRHSEAEQANFGISIDHLNKIRDWKKEDGYLSLLLFVKMIIKPYGRFIQEKTNIVRLEFERREESRKILSCLRKNGEFWRMCWYSSRRDYVFVFDIPIRYI